MDLYSFVAFMFAIQRRKIFPFFTPTPQLTKPQNHENTKLRLKSAECVITTLLF
jgi:hypothetical protein